MTATTALTAQDTRGVYDIHHVPADFLRKQIDACVQDIGVDVVKTGESRPVDSFRRITLRSPKMSLEKA
jgi:hydroxymethylpyrimidine/phosphomethylpyrimidine kinase